MSAFLGWKLEHTLDMLLINCVTHSRLKTAGLWCILCRGLQWFRSKNNVCKTVCVLSELPIRNACKILSYALAKLGVIAESGFTIVLRRACSSRQCPSGSRARPRPTR